jgi:hypothetical protein
VDDFSALDGEVGKRLNDMVPVPVSSSHFPGVVQHATCITIFLLQNLMFAKLSCLAVDMITDKTLRERDHYFLLGCLNLKFIVLEEFYICQIIMFHL